MRASALFGNHWQDDPSIVTSTERRTLRARTVSGVAWSATAQVLRQAAGLVVAAILSRYVSPSDFGTLAMVVVVTGFVSLLSDVGLAAAVINQPDVTDEQLSSVFWFTVGTGVALTGGVALGAPLVTWFYDAPELQAITLALTPNFIISAVAVVHRALLVRDMQFSKLAQIDSAAFLVSGLVACLCAVAGFGVWSLVAQGLTSAVASTLFIWLASSWRPSLRVSGHGLQPLLRYGLNLTGFNLLNYLMRNVDDVLVGKFAGSAALGFYSRAYTLMLLPLTQISQVLGVVMFPALSEIQNDRERTQQVYLAATRAIGLVAFPMMAGLFVTADLVVVVLFGETWTPVVPLLRVLCISGIGQAIGNTVGWLYMSQRRTDLQLRWGIFSSVVSTVAYVIGIRWGALGVAWAYVLSGYVILWYPAWRIPFSLIGLKFHHMIQNVGGVFLTALAMSAVVWLVDRIVVEPLQLQPIVALGLEVALGGCLYLGLCVLFKLQAFSEVLTLVRQRFQD